MKIIRDNVEIELTVEELRRAYDECKTEYDKDDLIARIISCCTGEDCTCPWGTEIDLPEDEMVKIGHVSVSVADIKAKMNDSEFMNDLVQTFNNALDWNDSFWSCYWSTVDYAIEEAFEEAFGK